MNTFAETPPRSSSLERAALSRTGLLQADLEGLDDTDARRLALWHRTKCGWDGARPWLPRRIRNLSIEQRLTLAGNKRLDLLWEQQELRAVRRSVAFFTFQYGHFQPEEGLPIPIIPWEGSNGYMGQGDVLREFERQLRVVILKARQLGLTWLALHFALHLMAFRAATGNAKVLGLSKREEDAKKLLKRVRRVNELLPPYLRQREHSDTVGSMSQFKLRSAPRFSGGGGEMISLPGTEDAARSETATLLLLDEFGFVPNGRAGGIWTAAQSTLGAKGRAIALSTGNGGPEVEGDGQAFAQLYVKASEGALKRWKAIFLPASTDPRRTDEWREEEKETYLTDEDFAAENPETAEEALAGKVGTRVYPIDGISAAIRLGAELDALMEAGKMVPPDGGAIQLGIDWGEQTHALIGWQLERGGLYIPPGETVKAHDEPGESSQAMLDAINNLRRWDTSSGSDIEVDDPELADEDTDEDPFLNWHIDLDEARYDAAGIQSMKTFLAVARKKNLTLASYKVAFGTRVPGSTSGRHYKHETTRYLRRLFRRAAKGKTSQVIAISPRNTVLVRQLRRLEYDDPDRGIIRKGDDHGPDALIALAAPVMVSFRAPER